jgi:ribosomal protein S12 methylthiotransferase accessory factor
MLERGQKAYTRGTHRVAAPAETLTRAQRVMGRLGITRLGTITGLDVLGIPVVNAFRPNSRSLAVSQGKGLDLVSAKVSALMESIELHHAENMTHPLRLASESELRKRHAVASVSGLPQRGFAGFNPDKQLLWVEGEDLCTGAPKLVPYEVVHMNFTLPLPTSSGCFVQGSNGLASGNERAEAILHGLLEVVERDATTLWMLDSPDRQQARRIDLATVDDAECRTLLSIYERAEVDVAVWDTTSDVGIPVFLCTILDRTRNPLRTMFPAHGMGCHPAREVALSRALTEAAQSRLVMIGGSRDDTGRSKYERQQEEAAWEKTRALIAPASVRAWSDVATTNLTTVDADLELALTRLKGAGLDEVIVVDLTDPELAIPVARVIVPGLEGMYEVQGYRPGPRARELQRRQEQTA